MPLSRYKFKANPVNENIMKNPSYGVKKVEPKEPTLPEGFSLETDRRIQSRHDTSSEPDEHYEFHAQPIPSGILEHTVVGKAEHDRSQNYFRLVILLRILN